MATSIVRTVVVYLFLVLQIRFMGKREIGQLQPTELVVMILMSELISVPLQEYDIPLLYGIIPVCILACLEIVLSALSLQFPKFRRVISGKSIEIIRDGKILQNELWKTRFSVEDLLEELRLKDIDSLNDVDTAAVETNGQLSVTLKPFARPVTIADLGIKPDETGRATVIIADGTLYEKSLKSFGKNREWVLDILAQNQLSDFAQVFLFTSDKYNNIVVIPKEKHT